MKDSFVFYRSFYNAISKVKDKNVKADIYDAICELGLNDNVQELDDSVGAIILELIKPQILANNERYANGKKGGRPKKEENHRLFNKKTIGFENKKPNVNENVNENDNVNVNLNVNVNDNVNDISADLFTTDETEKNADLFSFVQESFGRTFNSIEYDFISNWDDNELTRYAVKEGVLNSARNLKYVNSIIQSWKGKGFKTIADVQAYEDKRNKQKSNAVSTDDKILEKFDKAQTINTEASEEEQAEMEAILNEFSE